MEAIKPDNEQFIFRFFNTMPSENGDMVDLGSPLTYHNSPQDYEDNIIHKYMIGDILREPRVSMHKPHYFHGSDEDKTVPHRGWSVIGLSHPLYSLYNLSSHRSAFNDQYSLGVGRGDDNELIMEPSYKRIPLDILEDAFNQGVKDFGFGYVPKEDTIDMREALKEFQNNDKLKVKVPSRFYDAARTIDGLLDNHTVNDLFTNIDNYSEGPSAKSFNHAYNDKKALVGRYDRLLNILRAYANLMYKNPEAHLWLASVPVNSIYSAVDYANGRNRAQVDFPEELRVRNIRLLKDMHSDPNFKQSFMDDVSNWKQYARALDNEMQEKAVYNFMHPENVNEETLINNRRQDLLIDWAKNLIGKHFDIDPTQIASDELCKTIWMDLSNYHNTNTQHNIVNGLSGGDNKWR